MMGEQGARPRVCVITINFFACAKTRRCVESLRGQRFDTLYLIDNSVEPRERAGVSALAADARASGGGYNLRLRLNAENLGFAAAVNRAVAEDQAQGGHDYYLLLNNDTILPAGTIAGLVVSALNDPGAALVSPLIDWGGSPRGMVWYGRLTGHLSESSFPGAFGFLTGCCLLVRANLACGRPLLDDRFFMYGEDVALAWRVAREGLRCVCERSLTIWHEGSGSAGSRGFFYEYHMARGHLLLARDLARSALEYPLLVAGRVVYLGLRGLVRSVRYRSVVPLTALLMAPWKHGVRPSRRGGSAGPATPNLSTGSVRVDQPAEGTRED